MFASLTPGTDETTCSYLDQYFTNDSDVTNFRIYQAPPGHHMIVYAAKKKQAVCPHLGARFSDGGCEVENSVQCPYHNWSFDRAAPGVPYDRARLSLRPLPGAGRHRRSGRGASCWGQPAADPPGQPAVAIHCTMQEDVKVSLAIPHMHNYGLNITVDHIPKDGAAKRLFDTAWTPEMTFRGKFDGCSGVVGGLAIDRKEIAFVHLESCCLLVLTKRRIEDQILGPLHMIDGRRGSADRRHARIAQRIW